jgi:hypothetical protein
MLDEISQFLSDENMSARALAREWGITHPTVGKLKKEGFLQLHRDALRGLRERLHGQEKLGAPNCPKCSLAMKRSEKTFHWFYRLLRKCWTCSRKCNAGMYGVPAYGAHAEKVIRLDRARNPNTGQEVRLPWRHKESHYEHRYGWVWCDKTSGRPRGCGSVLSYQRTVKYKTAPFPYSIFVCRNQDCEYGSNVELVYCRGGKAWPQKPQKILSSLPARARVCPHCGGRVYRRMGKSYSVINPLRASRSELIRCRCTKCKRTLYFNVNLGKFTDTDELPIGRRLIEDAHRPSCRKCGPTRRFALRAQTLARNRGLAPSVVRAQLEGIHAVGNQTLAIRYSCQHKVEWKMPDGELITRRLKTENVNR